MQWQYPHSYNDLGNIYLLKPSAKDKSDKKSIFKRVN